MNPHEVTSSVFPLFTVCIAMRLRTGARVVDLHPKVVRYVARATDRRLNVYYRSITIVLCTRAKTSCVR